MLQPSACALGENAPPPGSPLHSTHPRNRKNPRKLAAIALDLQTIRKQMDHGKRIHSRFLPDGLERDVRHAITFFLRTVVMMAIEIRRHTRMAAYHFEEVISIPRLIRAASTSKSR